jgi:hypothetical protein
MAIGRGSKRSRSGGVRSRAASASADTAKNNAKRGRKLSLKKKPGAKTETESKTDSSVTCKVAPKYLKKFEGLGFQEKVEQFEKCFHSGQFSGGELATALPVIFPGDEKNRLWDRFKWIMKKADATTKESWDQVCQLPYGQDSAKPFQ